MLTRFPIDEWVPIISVINDVKLYVAYKLKSLRQKIPGGVCGFRFFTALLYIKDATFLKLWIAFFCLTMRLY